MSGSRDAQIVAQQLIRTERYLAGYRAMLEIASGFDMSLEAERLRREIIETENAVQHLRIEQRRLQRP